MGLFDLFRSSQSKVVAAEDRVWLSREAKRRAIAEAMRSRPPTFLIAHFDDCLAELNALVEESGIERRRVMVVKSSQLTPMTSPLTTPLVEIVVAERHPLRAHDERVVAFAESLDCRCQLAFHLALDDPLMRVVTGEWVERVLQQLGMQEDEAIENRMISRQIEKSQEKIRAEALGDTEARSSAEWFEKNCPALWRKVEGGE